jgi:LemA protein
MAAEYIRVFRQPGIVAGTHSWYIASADAPPQEYCAMGLVIVVIVLAVIVFWGAGIYNRLVTSRNGFKNAFAQIDVQLTRRNDLIPNLVETAKGYLQHERQTLEAVIAARNTAVAGLKAAAADPGSAAALTQLSGAEAGLGSALGRLFAVMEAYPDLKASSNMMQLSEEITSTENRIAFSRQAFNDAVLGYNNAREVLPNSFIASWFNFQPAKMLDAPPPEARVAPKVSFT